MQNDGPPLVGEGSAIIFMYTSVAWSALQVLTAVNLGILDRILSLFIQIAPHLSSRGWEDFIRVHYFSENLVAPVNEPGSSWSAAKNSVH
jgi:hypothetical protein